MSSPNPSKTQPTSLSLDGYIRMTFETFARLDFSLRKSWVDLELVQDLRLESVEATSAGYCEWETDSTGSVSIGWAWFDCPRGLRIIAPGGINTNVMLIAHRTQYDLGQGKTTEILQAWLAGEGWAHGAVEPPSS